MAGEDFCQRFKATLSPKDMAILELRAEGYGYQEIANKLGYKTHSAVVKRMEAIKRSVHPVRRRSGAVKVEMNGAESAIHQPVEKVCRRADFFA